jgi:hypothetical protein
VGVSCRGRDDTVMGMVEEETCKYKEAVKAKEVVVTY